MIRWVVAIAMCWATSAAMQPAVAHARAPLSSELDMAMCGEGAQTLSFEDLTPGRPLTVSPVLVDRDEAPSDEGPLAWCISPDDPRCSPRDQSAPLQSPRALVPMQDAAAMRWPALAALSGSDTLRPQQLGAPRAGVGLRLDRPPRA
jgi:hypothetical protein